MSRIFRWSRGNLKEEFNLASNDTSGACPSSLTSTDSSPSLDNDIPSKPKAVRRGDPGWVARPRNAFIIFRCEFSRLHAKAGKRVRRPPGTHSTEESVSKRAGDAWKQLSAEAKKPFKFLAAREKEEHARLYPDYRFCPTKREPSKKKKTASLPRSNSQPLIPSVTEPATESVPISFSQPSHEQGSSITQPPSPQPAQHPVTQPLPQPAQPPVNVAHVKAGRRRSSSVPLLPIGGVYAAFPGESVQPPKLQMKRSRSVLGNRRSSMAMSIMSTPYEGPSTFDPRMSQLDPSSGYVAPEEFSSFGMEQDVSRRMSSNFYQHPTMESSITVVGPHHVPSWDESYIPAAMTAWTPPPIMELQPLQSQGFPSEYNTTISDTYMNDTMVYSHEDQWAPASDEDRWAPASAGYSYPSPVEASLGLDSSGMLASPAILYNDNIAAAPGECGQVVDAHTTIDTLQASVHLNNSSILTSPVALYNDTTVAAPGECGQLVDAHFTIDIQSSEEAMLALNINDYLHYA